MTNYIQEGETLTVVCSYPASPVVNDPVLFGSMTGVAVNTMGTGGAGATETTVQFGGGVYDLSVTDTATGGIAVGATLYLHAASPCTIDNVSAGGYFFGFALESVSSGATATINVLHVQSPGAGTLATTVGTSNLAAGAVTEPKIGALAVTDPKILNIKANATVSAQAATATLTATSAGKIMTNTGASGAIVLTLPAAATMSGSWMRFATTVAQTITLTPAAGEKIYLNGSGVASKYALIAGVISNFVDVYCDGTDYFITNYSGVVTKEA